MQVESKDYALSNQQYTVMQEAILWKHTTRKICRKQDLTWYLYRIISQALLRVFSVVFISRKNFHRAQFYIPEGFAHGFLVLSDLAEFCYKCTDFYHPGDEGGLAWNDPEIGIKWPQLVGEYKGTASGEGYKLEDGTALNLSDKDQLWVGLKDTFKF